MKGKQTGSQCRIFSSLLSIGMLTNNFVPKNDYYLDLEITLKTTPLFYTVLDEFPNKIPPPNIAM